MPEVIVGIKFIILFLIFIYIKHIRYFLIYFYHIIIVNRIPNCKFMNKEWLNNPFSFQIIFFITYLLYVLSYITITLKLKKRHRKKWWKCKKMQKNWKKFFEWTVLVNIVQKNIKKSKTYMKYSYQIRNFGRSTKNLIL